jgi:hypothetical protein
VRLEGKVALVTGAAWLEDLEERDPHPVGVEVPDPPRVQDRALAEERDLEAEAEAFAVEAERDVHVLDGHAGVEEPGDAHLDPPFV